MKFDPEPLRVVCNSCGETAETWDYQHPDWAVKCGCCPLEHDHMGVGCRPVTIYATAHLTLFDINELMEMAAERDALTASEPPELDVRDGSRVDPEQLRN